MVATNLGGGGGVGDRQFGTARTGSGCRLARRGPGQEKRERKVVRSPGAERGKSKRDHRLFGLN